MPVKEPIKLHFITGFLGAGKTTLLNNLLAGLKNRKIGVIVNDFGEINVDAALIDGDKDLKISAINNGSIFCSCLSGSFVKSIVAYQDLPLDYLLVESSGMARPSSIEGILTQIEKLTGDTFAYRGMFCVVDATNFLTLVQSLNSLQEQVAYSNLILINKTDLVDENKLQVIEERIREINPEAGIIRTSFGEIDPVILEEDYGLPVNSGYSLTGCDAGRPETYFLKVEEPVKREKLLDFLKEIAPNTYRIKGFLPLEDGVVNVDSVGDRFKLKKLRKDVDVRETGLIIFSKIGSSLQPQIEAGWENLVQTPFCIS
ncbi:MAG: hypothetical protein PWR10_1145 [Halanaerobiales bacterium]|nr:hypothetical protein [Halanaerobiales bacterium]